MTADFGKVAAAIGAILKELAALTPQERELVEEAVRSVTYAWQRAGKPEGQR